MPKVADNQENLNQCVCARCPSYLTHECAAEKQELLYCAKGATACPLTNEGCICGACPVFIKNGLEGGFFCFNGAAV
ncbi:MAG: DUF2769 domain-containing protein [bacterium]|nr:DUF2769 domain-containing protein [bacterium]